MPAQPSKCMITDEPARRLRLMTVAAAGAHSSLSAKAPG
jgi:hypothetical protein